MHSYVWGTHRAKFDDDDFNSFISTTQSVVAYIETW